MTVAEMLERISSAELTEWMAFEKLNGPLGGRRHDYLAALQAHIAVTAASGKKGKKFKLADFVMEWGGKKRPRGGRALLEKFRGILPG
jgi:hypothetical protein